MDNNNNNMDNNNYNNNDNNMNNNHINNNNNNYNNSNNNSNDNNNHNEIIIQIIYNGQTTLKLRFYLPTDAIESLTSWLS